MTAVRLVVPCYNEADRFDEGEFLSLLDDAPTLGLTLVNDGSKDATEARLRVFAQRRPDRVEVVSLPHNRGKGEAVRVGLIEALRGPAQVVGYIDADLSTPRREILRLVETISDGSAAVVTGCRLSRLGSRIERSHRRHYLGRIFATLASRLLQVNVYDTQCGAKLFRRTPALEVALEEPFLSQWAFDVELLGRLLVGTAAVPGLREERFVEVPLTSWKDVPGSKMRVRHMVRALNDLAVISVDLRRRRLAR